MAMPTLRVRSGSNRSVCLSLPGDIVDRLNAIAERESRSLSGQVLYYVKCCLKEEEDAGSDAG